MWIVRHAAVSCNLKIVSGLSNKSAWEEFLSINFKILTLEAVKNLLLHIKRELFLLPCSQVPIKSYLQFQLGNHWGLTPTQNSVHIKSQEERWCYWPGALKWAIRQMTVATLFAIFVANRDILTTLVPSRNRQEQCVRPTAVPTQVVSFQLLWMLQV